MNWLKQKTEGRGQFHKVLAIALAVNVGLVLMLMLVAYSVKDITVTVNGKTARYKTISYNTYGLLREWGVTLDEKDAVGLDNKDGTETDNNNDDPEADSSSGLNARLEDGTDVKIDTYEVVEEVVEEKIKFKTKKSYTSDLLEGEEKVTRKGEKGIDKVTYKVSYLGKRELKRKEIARKTVKKPVTEKIEMGTAVSYNGEKYSRCITVVSTGYTHTGNRTATGTYPHRGTMAVDRGVIAMGSYGYVPGYGQVHAEDTGGAIQGNRIDLFFETRGQAIAWGRRTVTLYIK